jgi:MFS family permease
MTNTQDVEFLEQEKIGVKPSRLQKTFAALKYRNYRLWFWGQMTSLLGTWMQITAQGFLIYQLTNSPVYLGYIGFASGIPTWLFMLYGGVIADRIPKRKILIITQTIMMILAAILAFLTFTGIVEAWMIIILAFFLGITNAFDVPSRQALVNDLVDKEDLTNAIALNSTMFNSATAVGPATAGLIYALLGPGWCFTINAVSFIGVITALLKINLKTELTERKKSTAFEDIKEGLHYITHKTEVRTIIILVAFVSLFGISFTTLFPAWSVKILGGNAATNGLLFSARGIGALASALTIASLGRFNYKGKLLTAGTIAFPVFMFIFSLISWIPLTLLILFLVGYSLIMVFNLANALLQTIIPDNLRGRVMGVYGLTFFGFMPVGALFMGTTAETFSEPIAVMIGAAINLSASIIILLVVPKMRKL